MAAWKIRAATFHLYYRLIDLKSGGEPKFDW